ncbi:hypothetical protein ABB37_04428 [Leptomonas pyrrhocoris]|uniref:Diphthamide synthesis protein n=1 Tax=Leptomonas pyrrhocoris TaxID=157538 RepID=A0A0M9G2T5_LEPPY|nr:hypothetical protein ABB37_04428 [Leptomonas pyrrhocoris]KPA81067.1 hypothetical protein ABB37_04428 [Leptomonas pyrrhocoris]|eukprot:XP_015659506.1 hypothetical protein ABB37_04428 [Leptomonas pyrrhocoris]
MFHDAPVEAAVTVHLHRRHPAATTAASQDVSQRILHEYQLHRVADFLLTGDDRQETQLSTSTPSTQQGKKAATEDAEMANGEKPSCCQCRSSCATRASVAPYLRVALQFPDELLSDSVAVASALQHILTSDPRYTAAMTTTLVKEDTSSTNRTRKDAAATTSSKAAAAGAAVSARPPAMDNPHRPVGEVRLFVLADNTFGSCCPDEITAQHYTADCIVHFGDACMSRSTRLPVLYIQPAFHFDALLRDDQRGADQLDIAYENAALAAAETRVMVELVRRVAMTLRRRVTAWCAEKGGASTDLCTVAPRLTVVGTYPTKRVMQAAEQLWKDERRMERGDAAVVDVDWPRFEERDGIVSAPPVNSGGRSSDSTSATAVATEANATATDCMSPAEDDDWLVNGVRFRRLRTGDEARQEVQYLLFVGAAGSSALVHVLTAEHYNEFHYSDACRAFLEWDSGDEGASSVPVVTVVNNTFCADCDASGNKEREALQALIVSPTSDPNFRLHLKSSASAWLSVVLTDGVSALLTGDYVVAQQALQRRVRQRAFNIESVRASTAIGILVASLAIEGYYELTQQLHQLIRAYGKRSYVIYVGHLNEFKLANFVDTVDCFVAVACPYSRQSHFPEKRDNFMKPIVSPAELLVALTTADDTDAGKQYGMAAVYTTSFEAVLRVLTAAVQARKAEVACRAGGDEESSQRWREEEEERWASSGALVRAGGAANGALTVQANSQGALSRLYEREYVGLDPRIGQTPVQSEVMEGKHGIARGYAKEREEQHAEPPASQYR